MNEVKIGEIYLGDGVYGSVQYDQIKLVTESMGGRNIIFLEVEVLDRLINYAREKGLIK
jgi:hypothetical protein